jgi:hypothetical protein
MCGRPYDQCTKETFMKYLGLDNPQVPFPIYIEFLNDTSEESSYYNQTTFLCSEPVLSRYENKTACGCLVSTNLSDKDRNDMKYIYIGLSKIL